MPERLIKIIPCDNGELYETAGGQRRSLACFNGQIEIKEHTTLIPRLGTVQKGTKSIYASFLMCGDLEYRRETDYQYIHSGKVYDAVADVEGERLSFAGMRFEDSDPIKNELIFRITDLELVQKLLEI
ncbi:MAG: hypothetical protein [Chaetfec virus UA24_244]|nr:MAG: hypothetical protein [Chaetfec virus UA24_244]